MIKENVENVVSGNDMGMEGTMHISDIYIVGFKDKSKGIYKTFKEAAVIGEVSFYELSQIIGNDLCPETTKVDFGKGEGSCQKWIVNGREPWDGRELSQSIHIKEKHFSDLAAIFVQDMIVGNWDRHAGNIIIKDDKCYAIDNEDWGTKGASDDYTHALDERSGLSDVS